MDNCVLVNVKSISAWECIHCVFLKLYTLSLSYPSINHTELPAEEGNITI